MEVLADGAGRVLAPIVGEAESGGRADRRSTSREPDLEAVFLHLTGKALRD